MSPTRTPPGGRGRRPGHKPFRRESPFASHPPSLLLPLPLFLGLAFLLVVFFWLGHPVTVVSVVCLICASLCPVMAVRTLTGCPQRLRPASAFAAPQKTHARRRCGDRGDPAASHQYVQPVAHLNVSRRPCSSHGLLHSWRCWSGACPHPPIPTARHSPTSKINGHEQPTGFLQCLSTNLLGAHDHGGKQVTSAKQTRTGMSGYIRCQ